MTKNKHGLLISLIVPYFLLMWWFCAIRVNNPVILPAVNEVLLLDQTHRKSHQHGLIIEQYPGKSCKGYCWLCIGSADRRTTRNSDGLLFYGFNLFNNFLGLFRPIPPLAWVPLVLAWFGVASFATLLGVEQGQLYIWLSSLKISMVFIIFIGAFSR